MLLEKSIFIKQFSVVQIFIIPSLVDIDMHLDIQCVQGNKMCKNVVYLSSMCKYESLFTQLVLHKMNCIKVP